MRSLGHLVVAASCFGLSALILSGAVTAEELGSVTVSGRGIVKVVPSVLDVQGTISAEAELAGDALTKFRSAKDAVQSAMERLGVDNLNIEFFGFQIGSAEMARASATQIILGRAQGQEVIPKVLIQESIRLRVTKIDALAPDKVAELIVRLVDTGKDAGLQFGPPVNANRIAISRDEPPGFAVFSLADADEQRRAAEKLAVDDARARAERLAVHCGGRLDQIRSVQEMATPYYSTTGLRPSTPEQSSKFEPVEIAVTVQVVFGLRHEPTEK